MVETLSSAVNLSLPSHPVAEHTRNQALKEQKLNLTMVKCLTNE